MMLHTLLVGSLTPDPNHNANAIPILHLRNADKRKIVKNCANIIAKNLTLPPTLAIVMTIGQWAGNSARREGPGGADH